MAFNPLKQVIEQLNGLDWINVNQLNALLMLALNVRAPTTLKSYEKLLTQQGLLRPASKGMDRGFEVVHENCVKWLTWKK